MFKWLPERPVPPWASFFDRGEFDEFVRAVADDLQRRADIVEIDDAVARVDLGDGKRQFGLQQLAQVCNQTSPDEWPELIREHFDSLIRGAAVLDLTDLGEDFEEVRSRLKLRLYPRSALQGAPESAVWRPLGPDLAVVLVYDLPGAVAPVAPSALGGWPVDESEVFDLALEIVDVGELCAVVDDSYYVTSQLLALDRYIEPQTALGAVVAVPNRHTLLFAPIVDVSVLGLLNALALIAHRRYAEGPGSLSPNLYWWTDGELVVLPTEVDGDEVEFEPPESFIRLCLGRLARPGRDVGPN